MEASTATPTSKRVVVEAFCREPEAAMSPESAEGDSSATPLKKVVCGSGGRKNRVGFQEKPNRRRQMGRIGSNLRTCRAELQDRQRAWEVEGTE
ncbi:UNVERIFIED_CONTAM: hypothetical protein HHA_236290 [Hammondia hammondi]|eukprot:XP_008885483.1 hypothetical protein HHA_236290 [Hammondia hammondi]